MYSIVKQKWKQVGIWKDPTDMREIKKTRIAPSKELYRTES
ncbi:hypothetical protein V4W76_11110 [Bacillus thuringiensis]